MDQLKLDPKLLNAERYVAVAVDRDTGSQNAVRWAADNLLMEGQSVTLIHVNQGYLSCPSPARSMGISKSSSTRSTKSGSSDIDDLEQFDQSQDIFLPFRAYTSSKDISCDAVIIDDFDIVKALIEYVKLYRIETLVLGAASRHGITRIFSKHDIPTAVLKGAPDFCNVFVISKEKVNFAKTASRPLRSLSLTAAALPVGRHNSITKENNNFKATTRTTRRVLHGPGEKIASLNIYSSMNARERGMIEALELNHEVSSLHAKNMKSPRKMRSQGGWISPICDNSKSQSRKPSKCLSINSLVLKSNLEKVKSDDNDKRESSDIKTDEIKEKQLIPEESEALEEKMRLLELQMKQTMEMYHGACKEALKAKKKNKELQLLRKEDERKLAEALVAKDEALTIAEKEKAMRILAIETAKVAQTKANEEAHKRNTAEKELLELADETRMMLHSIDDSQTILNCEEKTCRNLDKSEEDERKLAEALMEKEEALAIAEKEKAMRIVAIETAKVAQTKADEEARKRNAAEKELLELADETRMILHSLDDSQTIVNCEKTTCGNSMVKSEKDAS